mmetsp:Transcript_5345/g.15589  ORF Transcript_5345/g.15589 Transcript_5345/m.15589 type:complete len:206 (-) Transcript_5345:1029-1646(-)
MREPTILLEAAPVPFPRLPHRSREETLATPVSSACHQVAGRGSNGTNSLKMAWRRIWIKQRWGRLCQSRRSGDTLARAREAARVLQRRLCTEAMGLSLLTYRRHTRLKIGSCGCSLGGRSTKRKKWTLRKCHRQDERLYTRSQEGTRFSLFPLGKTNPLCATRMIQRSLRNLRRRELYPVTKGRWKLLRCMSGMAYLFPTCSLLR